MRNKGVYTWFTLVYTWFTLLKINYNSLKIKKTIKKIFYSDTLVIFV